MGYRVVVQVLSCLDDDNQSTRLVSCKVLRAMLLYKPKSLDGWFDTISTANLFIRIIFAVVDKLHTIYCDLLKRLDDSSDDVRIATTQTLMSYIQ